MLSDAGQPRASEGPLSARGAALGKRKKEGLALKARINLDAAFTSSNHRSMIFHIGSPCVAPSALMLLFATT